MLTIPFISYYSLSCVCSVDVCQYTLMCLCMPYLMCGGHGTTYDRKLSPSIMSIPEIVSGLAVITLSQL